MPLRVVVDRNVYISTLIGGEVGKLRPRLFSESVRLVISERLLAEIADVGSRSHLVRYFNAAQLQKFLDLLRDAGEFTEDPSSSTAISRDAEDDYLLALAKAAKADVLLTGDKDLLVLGKHGRTRIMNARSFAKEFLSGK